MKLFDAVVIWKGFHGGDAKTQIQLFDNVVAEGRKVVILTEPNDNAGTSITNGIEIIVPIAVAQLKLNPHDCVLIEHYPERGNGSGKSPETFDRVTVDWTIDLTRCKSPRWEPLRWEKIATLIGEGGKTWTEV